MTILTYAQRQAHWNWCREFIDREVFYRADDTHPRIPGKRPGTTYRWQGYFRRATYNPHFARAIGLLFWDHFLPVYQQQPFQVCACEPSGPPIGMAILAMARKLNIPLNMFICRREPKTFGFNNWFEGVVLPDVPVLIVDDVAASAPHMKWASARIQSKLGLPLHCNYFAIKNKVGRNLEKAAQHTENYLDNELVALFTMNNFSASVDRFKERYGHPPQWTGLVK
jgi:hypothetical protein